MEDAPKQIPGTDLVLARPTGTKTRDWPPAVQCGGTRSDGEQCRRKATRGGDRCEVHGARLPCVREAYARRVEEARRRIVNLADPALDALERALADKDSAVAVRAAQTVLDRVVPRPGTRGLNVVVGIGGDPVGASPADLVRARLARLRDRQQPQALPWDGEPLEGSAVSRSWTRVRLSDWTSSTGWPSSPSVPEPETAASKAGRWSLRPWTTRTSSACSGWSGRRPRRARPA
jgi:hypothetical protein